MEHTPNPKTVLTSSKTSHNTTVVFPSVMEGIWVDFSDHNYSSTSVTSYALTDGVLPIAYRLGEPKKHQRPGLPRPSQEALGNHNDY